MEEKTTNQEQQKTPSLQSEQKPGAPSPVGFRQASRGQRGDRRERGSRGRFGRGGRRGGGKPQDREFDQVVVDIARVTRVMAGGKRMSFRACVVIGDRKGRIGYGVKKGKDVSQAIQKAVNQGKKNMLAVPIANDTIPHEVMVKFGAAKIMLRPAEKGRGILAGGPVRSVLELSGIKDVVTKMLGSKNKINNVKATFKGLASLRLAHQVRRQLKGEVLEKETPKPSNTPLTA